MIENIHHRYKTILESEYTFFYGLGAFLLAIPVAGLLAFVLEWVQKRLYILLNPSGTFISGGQFWFFVAFLGLLWFLIFWPIYSSRKLLLGLVTVVTAALLLMGGLSHVVVSDDTLNIGVGRSLNPFSTQEIALNELSALLVSFEGRQNLSRYGGSLTCSAFAAVSTNGGERIPVFADQQVFDALLERRHNLKVTCTAKRYPCEGSDEVREYKRICPVVKFYR